MFYVSLPSTPLPTSANSQSLAEASPQLSSAIFKHFVMNYLMSPDGLQIMDILHNSTHFLHNSTQQLGPIDLQPHPVTLPVKSEWTNILTFGKVLKNN